jgi:hypothetical protein
MNRTKKPKPAIQDTTTADLEVDIFFVDQLSICIPLLRLLTARWVVFYCHFPDILLASGEFIDDFPSASAPPPMHNCPALTSKIMAYSKHYIIF